MGVVKGYCKMCVIRSVEGKKHTQAHPFNAIVFKNAIIINQCFISIGCQSTHDIFLKLQTN